MTIIRRWLSLKSVRYAIMGFLVGISVPVALSINLLSAYALAPTWENLLQVYRSQPWLLLILAFPLLFAGLAGMAGNRNDHYDQLVQQRDRRLADNQAELQRMVNELEQENLVRRQAEAIISRGKREWEATFDAVTDMIILADMDGRVMRCNDATAQWFQASYTELLGKPVVGLFGEALSAGQQSFNSPGNPAFYGRWYDVSVYPIFMEETELGSLYILRDNDPAGERASATLIDRATAEGIEAIVLAPEHGDFNDDLRRICAQGLHAALRGQLAPQDVDRFMRLSP